MQYCSQHIIEISKICRLIFIYWLVDSFSADFIFGVGGKVCTKKYYLFSQDLHSMARKKEAVKIMHRLGHCETYDKL